MLDQELDPIEGQNEEDNNEVTPEAEDDLMADEAESDDDLGEEEEADAEEEI